MTLKNPGPVPTDLEEQAALVEPPLNTVDNQSFEDEALVIEGTLISSEEAFEDEEELLDEDEWLHEHGFYEAVSRVNKTQKAELPKASKRQTPWR